MVMPNHKITPKSMKADTLVPEVFFSLGATELSGEAARKKPLVPTDNNLTSMPTPIPLIDIRSQSLF